MSKLIPSAMTDFKKIIENNYAFVDKTRFLEVYEKKRYIRIHVFKAPEIRQNHVYRAPPVLLRYRFKGRC